MVQLRRVRVQVLFPNLRTTGEEGRTRDEQKVKNNNTYFWNTNWSEAVTRVVVVSPNETGAATYRQVLIGGFGVYHGQTWAK